MSDPRMDRVRGAREHLLRHLVDSGVDDPRLLAAFANVPRERFVIPDYAHLAYRDVVLPIGEQQSITQPSIVAQMASAARLAGDERLLEIGCGSGYAAAIFAELCSVVYAVEIRGRLARLAESRLHRLGYANVLVRHGDGTLGWPEHAPYDVIVVAAGAPGIPEALLAQLAEGGRMIIPIGPRRHEQELMRLTKIGDDDYFLDKLGPVRFAPLTGAEAWGDRRIR